MNGPDRTPRVLIVAESASAKFGGEAILPLHCFRKLRARGVEAWMVVHDRTRHELAGLMPAEAGRISYVPDLWLHKMACRVARFLPDRVAHFTVGYVSRLSSQIIARRIVRRLVAEHCEALGVPACVQVGATLDFIAGRMRRAPVFYQKVGLEWAYRMWQEPARLFPRYARNAWFIARATIADAIRRPGAPAPGDGASAPRTRDPVGHPS